MSNVKFYMDALEISNKKFYNESYFTSQLPQSLKRLGKSIYNVALPWIAGKFFPVLNSFFLSLVLVPLYFYDGIGS